MDRRVKERLVGATILVVLIVLIVPELLSGPKRSGLAPPPAAVGPAEPVRNVTVDLATSKATPAEEATAASATPQEGPSSAAATMSSGEAAPGDTARDDTAAGDAGAGQAAAGVPAPGEPGRAASKHAAAPTITTLRAQQPAPPVLENEPSPPKSAATTSKSGAARAAAPADTSRHKWAVQIGSFASQANAEKLVRQLKPHESSAYVSSSGKGPSLRYRVRIGPLADRGAAEREQLKLRKEGLSATVVPP
ncbi:MAG TPA: SPOR domain-containing protein [Steroidobacteraceae bacterium]